MLVTCGVVLADCRVVLVTCGVGVVPITRGFDTVLVTCVPKLPFCDKTRFPKNGKMGTSLMLSMSVDNMLVD